MIRRSCHFLAEHPAAIVLITYLAFCVIAIAMIVTGASDTHEEVV